MAATPRLSSSTLARLVAHERYKGGSVKTWRDPETRKTYSAWTIRKVKAGGISPKKLSKARKQSTRLASEQKKTQKALNEMGHPFFDMQLAAVAWVRVHGGSIEDAMNEPGFWRAIREELIAAWEEEIDKYEVESFEFDRDPGEVFWYH